jgi:circadian clock protein KaiC
VYRLHEWLLTRGLTGMITTKAGADDTATVSPVSTGFMQFRSIAP